MLIGKGISRAGYGNKEGKGVLRPDDGNKEGKKVLRASYGSKDFVPLKTLTAVLSE